MQIIQELNSVSNYQPVHGVLLDLYKIVIDKNITRKSAILNFKDTTGNSSFKVPYKRLKDKLLQGILENSFNNLSKVQKQHIDTFKKYTESKILLLLHKRIAGVKIAEETIKKAEWLGMTEIALSLSRDLHAHFIISDGNNRKYQEYDKKIHELKLLFDQEYEVQCLYLELRNLSRKKNSNTSIFQKTRKNQ